jgi:phosphohistidine phosphatase SixA
VLSLGAVSGAAAADQVDTAAWAALQRDGAILLLRHANAPGVGDPPGFQLGDCSSQRNLDATGRVQARRIGEGLRARGVAVRAVYSSRWCRARETADLAFPRLASEQAVFDSFFGERRDEPARTAAARTLLAQWKGPGVLAVTTHQVNITALTGVAPASGEGVVVRVDGERVEVLGRVAP